MPTYICKFQDGEKAYYLEWSTIVDAPITTGMSLQEFKQHYRGPGGVDLQGRMDRVEAKGVSARDYDSLDALISGNRAGKGGSCLSKEQIIEWYCRRAEECLSAECPLQGKVLNLDTGEYE